MDIKRIESNWETYSSLLRKLEDENIDNMLEFLGDRIATCPSSMKLDQVGCYPGGLVENSLEVASAFRTLNSAFEYKIPVESILKVIIPSIILPISVTPFSSPS